MDGNHPIDLVVFGDSHAMSITPVLDKLCQEHAWRGTEVTRFTVNSIFEFSDLPDRPKDTNDWSFGDVAVDYIQKNQVKNVVVAAHWTQYPDTDEFRSNVISTVRAILGTGARVFLLEDYPQQDPDFQAQIDYRILNGRDFDQVGVTPEQHREKQHDFVKMFGQISGMGAVVLDPADYFLNGRGRYGAVKNNQVLYFDEHHLTVQGAMVLTPLFEPIFKGNTN